MMEREGGREGCDGVRGKGTERWTSLYMYYSMVPDVTH